MSMRPLWKSRLVRMRFPLTGSALYGLRSHANVGLYYSAGRAAQPASAGGNFFSFPGKVVIPLIEKKKKAGNAFDHLRSQEGRHALFCALQPAARLLIEAPAKKKRFKPPNCIKASVKI